MRKVDVLKDVQDFIVIEKSGKDNFVYAAKPSFDVMKQFYEQSISNPDDKNIDAFQKYWEFDENKGIKGSSTFLALRFDKLALRANGLWIPSLLEAKVLDKQGKLENRVYRDYGTAVYNENEPNRYIAETLVSQAKKLSLELPLIVPFKALDYNVEGKEIKPFFAESPAGIISGKKVQDEINSLDYKGNSGIQRLDRGGDGNWDADWDYLDDSDEDGRVDWICGEATKKILTRAYFELNERKYGLTIKELKEKQRLEFDSFKKSLKK